MTNENTAKKIAKTGVRTVADIVLFLLKLIGTVILTMITTGIVFACICAMYIKTNLANTDEIKLETYALSLSSVICYLDPNTGIEQELVTLQSKEFRIWADYDEMPYYMEQALVAIEDQRFYKHQGVDWYRTSGAFVNMFLSMKNDFGGSTITQQLIKNLTDEDEVTVQRKLNEIFRALELERNYDKDEIVELYLNRVYFGHGCYGVGAAAEYYFGKEVSELTLAECASIVSITNNPSIFSPYVSRTKNKERQETILQQMYLQGYIPSEAALKTAINEELNFQRGENNEYEDVVYTWFEEAVIRDVIRDLVEQKGYPERVATSLLFYGGYRIVATIDMDMQAKVDSIYQNLEEIPETTGTKTNKQLQSSIVITDPYTGEIKALAGGVGQKRGNMLLNRATQTRRSPGSSLKPLSVYAPAIEYSIISPDTKYDDSEYVTLEGEPTYKPKNYDRKYSGIVDIRQAVRSSLNTIAAQVLDDLKPSVSYRFLTETLGFELDRSEEGYAALALGQFNYGVTVREMASAFTMLPNMGERMPSYTYTKVYDAKGALILENKPNPVSAISEPTAYWMTDLLVDAVNKGTGKEARLDHMPVAGKTGSTTDMHDRWFAGYTPHYVAIVWTGFDLPEQIILKNGRSGNPAAQLWKKVMTLVHEDLEQREFTTPENTKLNTVTNIVTVRYTVKCVDTAGNILQEKSNYRAVGRTVTEYAPQIENYRLLSEGTLVTTLSSDSGRNNVVFTYEYSGPPQTSDEPQTPVEPPDNPDTDTGTEPDPEQNQDPQPQIPLEPENPPPEEPEQSPDTSPPDNSGNTDWLWG